MNILWVDLDNNERNTVQAMILFLKERLAEPATIQWALKKTNSNYDNLKRHAIVSLLNRSNIIKKPWIDAWRLIEESWHQEKKYQVNLPDLKCRLQQGDRSSIVVSEIINLVEPRLNIKISNSLQNVKKANCPETFEDLLTVGLTSGKKINLGILTNVSDISLLISLANALEATVNHGLDMGRRIGWDGGPSLKRLGLLERARYTTSTSECETDTFSRGIAPSVKLLNEVVMRIAKLDPELARPFIQRWRILENSPIHLRLWAAAARAFVSAEEVEIFLADLDDLQFWNLHSFPEVAELRALRFHELNEQMQDKIVKRLCSRPPRDYWPNNLPEEKIENGRLYWTARELKRIEVMGGKVPSSVRCLLKDAIKEFPELDTMEIEFDLPRASFFAPISSGPGIRYDMLSGVDRLRVIEKKLSSRDTFDGYFEQTNHWLNQSGKTLLILDDFESTGNGGEDFPCVWECFCHAHKPEELEQPQNQEERVLKLLEKLSDQKLMDAIRGISEWFYVWKKKIMASSLGVQVWKRIWPLAVKANNDIAQSENAAELSISPYTTNDDQHSTEIDSLNTPVGKLVDVFLEKCRQCRQIDNYEQLFSPYSTERIMRDTIILATGKAGLIVRDKIVYYLPFFMKNDETWTKKHLIADLQQNDEKSLVLWDTVACRAQPANILKHIGNMMVWKVTDLRLTRETRKGLVFSLITESLHALHEGRQPDVSNLSVQQMLRIADSEIRVGAVDAVRKFILSHSGNDGEQSSATQLFQISCGCFFKDVWPQERSLTTKSVSEALACLPAASREAFPEAVKAIKRFLIPFECYSMSSYDFFESNGETKISSIIDNAGKAGALLELLDLTVGTSEADAVPYDLSIALARIQALMPDPINNRIFQRLSAAVRRRR